MTHTTHNTTPFEKAFEINKGVEKKTTKVGPSKAKKASAGLGNTISRPACVRARNWFFTLNNYEQKDIDHIISLDCNYVFQEEQGESGTKHLQGVLMYKNARSFTSIKKILPRAHIEVCKDVKSSIRYCCKSETRVGNIFSSIPLDDYQEEEDEEIPIKPLTFDEQLGMELMQMRLDMANDKELNDLIEKISFTKESAERRYGKFYDENEEEDD